MSHISTGGSTHTPFLHIRLLFALIAYSQSVKWGESVSKVDISVPGDRKQGTYVHTVTCKASRACIFHGNTRVGGLLEQGWFLPVQISTNSAAIVIGQEVAVAHVQPLLPSGDTHSPETALLFHKIVELNKGSTIPTFKKPIKNRKHQNQKLRIWQSMCS